MGKDNNSVNILGQKFGRWSVINKSSKRDRSECVMWECICECGNTGIVRGTELRKGLSTSCGCRRDEVSSLAKKHGASSKNGNTPEYDTWQAMKSRCYDKTHSGYENYGGRGIIVCERWLNSFEDFLQDVGVKPSSKHSLDRFPNVDGNYEPNNFRWATTFEQARNKRNNRYLEYKGDRMILNDWGIKLSVHYSCIHRRLQAGQSFESIVEYYQNKNKAA